MLGIPRELVEHRLNMYLGAKPVKQTLCRFVDPKCEALG
jgi:hypothetical protein